ncbi:MAG: hypothetical protein B7Z58_17315 [Acidiphilium sp. 37-64-53]|uniref:VTT domain-containing protein n=1 Tax=Acidiphilium sp. 37-64-53 TaxID=1970299 RepID=UPI000BC94C44|nr:VTT domain-containing protein [Acidiphilium sp. 37-64-53]OYV99911.1 MAG: hypothetical protein B7Z58_17315 [Acidiphilium sp. 37-64-53]HQT89831.1 VTT domain-containing protein [Acidiphilium sp.]
MISHWVQSVVDFARAHTLLAYGLAFLLTGAEAFPIVGALVPGTAVIIALGALVPAGALRFWPLVAFATTGAIAGDGFSYWLGHRYKLEAANHWPLRGHPSLIERGEAFFRRYGGKAILVARFTPGVRAVVPLVAGITGMPAVRFYTLNIISAVLWAPAHVVMGVLIGASLTILGAVAGRLEALIVGFFVVLLLIIWLTPRAIGWLVRLMNHLRGPALTWARSRDSWFRRTIVSLLDPDTTEIPGLVALGGVLIGSTWLFFGVMQDLISGDPLVRADRSLLHLLLSMHVGWATQLAAAVTEIGSGTGALAATGAALIWLGRRKAWRAMVYTVSTILGAVLFSAGLNLLLGHSKSLLLNTGQRTSNLPGIHLAAFAALLGFLTIVMCRELTTRYRVLISIITITFLVALAFSRLYLGTEYLSIALESIAFGAAWATLLSIAYLARKAEVVRPVGLGCTTAIVFVVVGMVNIRVFHDTDMRRFSLKTQTQTMSLTQWRHGGWTHLPRRRLALFGEFDQPFTVQWVGSTAAIRSELHAHGWKLAPQWTFKSMLQFLAPHVNLALLPVLPRLASGRTDGLVMVRPSGAARSGNRIVLRLWRSNIEISQPDGKISWLWDGTIVVEHVQRLFSTLNTPVDTHNLNKPLRQLASAIPDSLIVRRSYTSTTWRWNGDTLLGSSNRQ